MPHTTHLLLIFKAAAISAGHLADEPPTALATFTLVRGGSAESDYHGFIHSRRCLREALPSWFTYDNVAFHEGNVPAGVHETLRRQV